MATVQSCGHRHAADINFSDEKSASKWEGLATICITRARAALKQPTGTYTKVHRDTLSDLLKAMLVTQGSISKLLEGGSESPQSVDALALARLQVEGLFLMCLLTEGSEWVDRFLRDGWKKQFIRYLLFKHETECLPRFGPNAHVPELSRLVNFAGVCGVSTAQLHTVENEQTGMPLPADITKEKIPDFPTPGGVIGKIQAQTKRKMLAAGLMELADLHRQRRLWREAVQIWTRLAYEDHALAMERLAKYYEHVCRDPRTALLWSSRLLQVQADDPQHHRRQARLIERINASS